MKGKSRENVEAVDRQRETEVLKEIEKIYKLLLESTSDSIYALDRKWRFILVNSATERFTGLQKEELLGKKITEVFPGIEKTKIFESFERVMEKGKAEVASDEYVFKDGKRGWYEVRVYPSPRGILCISRDVTEQKEMEKKLKESEERARMMLNATHDMAIMVDWEGNIVDLNDALAESLGSNRNELIGKNLRDILPEDVFERRYSCALEVMSTKKPVQFEDERNGRWFDNRIYPVFDEKGEVCMVADFVQDITERRKLEQQLIESRETAKMMLNATHDMVALADFDGTIIDLNNALAELLGDSRENLVGKNFKDILKKKVFEDAYSCALEVKRTKKPVHIEYEQNGRWFDNRIYPVFDEKGEVCMIADFLQDITEYKELEKKLRKMAETAQTLLNATHDMVLLLEWDATIIDMNDAMAKSLGINKKEAIGKNLREYLPPEIFESRHNRAIKLKETKEPVRFIDRRGEKYLDNIFYPIFDEKGEVFRIAVFSRDITDRKKAEQEIMHLNQFLESVVENANVWLDVLDENGNVALWNKAAEKISGYSAEEVVGHGKIWEWLYPDEGYRKEITEKAAAIIKYGEVVEDFETIIRCKDGNIKIISWNSRNIVDSEGKPIGSIALGRDITARKEAEKELAKFKAIADIANYGVAIADIDGTIQYVNEYYASVHGYSVNEVIGKNISIFYNEEQVEKAIELRNMLIKGDISGAREVWHIHKDGHVFPMMMSGVLIKDNEGKPLYVAVTALDITEYKIMEEQMLQQEKMASVGKIASVVSHELNTPLANIGITAEYLKSLLPEEYKKELDVILQEVRNASNIIKKTLNFSRMGSMEFREVNINAIIEKAVEAVKKRRNMAGIKIKTVLSPSTIMGDEYRLFEAMVNIIDNAVLARNSENKMHVINITSTPTDNNIVVTVEDNGVGMSDATLQNSDKPFFTTRANGEGAGLGLFISKWIIEKHGGTIYIESKEGKGTNITITIPRRVKGS